MILDPFTLQDSDPTTVRGLLARSLIPFRDGSVTYSGGVGAACVNPWTGVTVADGAGATFDLQIPGFGPLRMMHAQGARTDIQPDTRYSAIAVGDCIKSAGSRFSQAVKATLAGGSKNHYIAPMANPSFAINTTYAESVYFRDISIPNGTVIWEGGGTDRGTANNLIITNGVIVSGTGEIHDIGGGWYRISRIFTTPAVVTGSFSQALYAGVYGAYDADGAEYEYAEPQLEQAAFPGMLIPTAGAAAGRTADTWRFTLPTPATGKGEWTGVWCPYLHGGSLQSRILSSTDYDTKLLLSDNGSNNGEFYTNNSTGGVFVGPAKQSCVIRTISGFTDPGVSAFASINGVAGTTFVPDPSVSFSEVVIGDGVGSDLHAYGPVTVVYTPGGATQAEREALFRLVSRTLTPVA